MHGASSGVAVVDGGGGGAVLCGAFGTVLVVVGVGLVEGVVGVFGTVLEVGRRSRSVLSVAIKNIRDDKKRKEVLWLACMLV